MPIVSAMKSDGQDAGESGGAEMEVAYQRYVDARLMPTPSREYSGAAVREMQRAMLDALRAPGALPEEMRLHLAIGFEHLCAGIDFDLLMPVKQPGGREPPIAKVCQRSAIRYLRWCEDGRIRDVSPVRTVAKAYDVGERTVRLWKAKWGAKPTPPLQLDHRRTMAGLEHPDEPQVGTRAEKEGEHIPLACLSSQPDEMLVAEIMKSDGQAYRRFIKKPKARLK